MIRSFTGTVMFFDIPVHVDILGNVREMSYNSMNELTRDLVHLINYVT